MIADGIFVHSMVACNLARRKPAMNRKVFILHFVSSCKTLYLIGYKKRLTICEFLSALAIALLRVKTT